MVTHLREVFLFLFLYELWSHGTVQPRRSLTGVWDLLLRRELFNSLPLFVFKRGEPGIDESPVREQSTRMDEP